MKQIFEFEKHKDICKFLQSYTKSTKFCEASAKFYANQS